MEKDESYEKWCTENEDGKKASLKQFSLSMQKQEKYERWV